MQDIFLFRATGRNDNRITGNFQGTGVVPRIVDELANRGIQEIDRNWFGRQA